MSIVKHITLPIISIIAVTLLIFSFFQFMGSVKEFNEIKDVKYATNQEKEVLSLINGYREVHGLSKLELNNQLNLSSYIKVNEMKTLRYWGHNTPNGDEPWRHFYQAQYNYSKAGENLAKCYTDNVTMVQAWIDSPKHKEVMLDDYKDFGMSVENVDGCEYVVTHYGAL